MKKDLTEIAIILDESGSMSDCKNDTIGGVNEFLTTQQKIKGEANLTLIKFSNYYKVINDCTPIANVTLLNSENYTPSASTSLLDAVGKTINTIGNRLSKTDESDRPEKVIMLIVTDGEENSSTEFTRKQISDMVKHQKDVYKWEFVFIGADIDAWGEEIGITSNVNFSKQDLNRSFKGMSFYTANYRTNVDSMSMSDFNLSDEELDKGLENLSK